MDIYIIQQQCEESKRKVRAIFVLYFNLQQLQLCLSVKLAARKSLQPKKKSINKQKD